MVFSNSLTPTVKYTHCVTVEYSLLPVTCHMSASFIRLLARPTVAIVPFAYCMKTETFLKQLRPVH